MHTGRRNSTQTESGLAADKSIAMYSLTKNMYLDCVDITFPLRLSRDFSFLTEGIRKFQGDAELLGCCWLMTMRPSLQSVQRLWRLNSRSSESSKMGGLW